MRSGAKSWAAHQRRRRSRPTSVGSVRACSWHRDQRRRDAPPLADHDVVGADRRTGLHRVQHHVHRAQRLAQRPMAAARPRCRCRRSAYRCHWRRRTRGPAKPRRFPQVFVDRPGPDRIRQAQQRAAMRHVGERKAALAVSLDRRRPRKMRSVRAARHASLLLSALSGASRWVPTPR